MGELNLIAKVRHKRKYNSYKATTGKMADNLINRQFEASSPLEKCYTDVTEFTIGSGKLYLSPNLDQTRAMLQEAFTSEYYENTILHSDHGRQYQHKSYHVFLESKGIRASMSRKSNSPDNGMMESFFRQYQNRNVLR